MTTSPRVFISYSHDSPEHSERVLSLAWALRRNGIDVEIDQFHNERIVDWPRWCSEQTSREHSDFVVCVCTAEYKRRIDGHVPPEKGKGVYWEGTLIDDDLYDEKGNRRIIPALFDDEAETSIPRFLRGWTRCRLCEFDLRDAGFEHLVRILTKQVKVEKNPLGDVPLLAVKRAPSVSELNSPQEFVADDPANKARRDATPHSSDSSSQSKTRVLCIVYRNFKRPFSLTRRVPLGESSCQTRKSSV
jgi:hypothetical protein